MGDELIVTNKRHQAVGLPVPVVGNRDRLHGASDRGRRAEQARVKRSNALSRGRGSFRENQYGLPRFQGRDQCLADSGGIATCLFVHGGWQDVAACAWA